MSHAKALAVVDAVDTARLRASLEFEMEGLEESLYQRLCQRLETHAQAWLSVNGAAGYLDTSPAAVRQLIQRGHLRAYRPKGGSIRLSREEIDEWVRGSA